MNNAEINRHQAVSKMRKYTVNVPGVSPRARFTRPQALPPFQNQQRNLCSLALALSFSPLRLAHSLSLFQLISSSLQLFSFSLSYPSSSNNHRRPASAPPRSLFLLAPATSFYFSMLSFPAPSNA